MSGTLSPRFALTVLATTIGLLVFLHGAMVVAQYAYDAPGFLKLRALFDLNGEQNIPTLFSTTQLLLASLLLLLLSVQAHQSGGGSRGYWAGLSLIFAFLAGDEFCEWHERLIDPLRKSLHVTGALSFAWVIPYSAAVLVFVAAYAKFWWRLPTRTRLLFAVAGVLYVGGGIVMEMAGSWLFTRYGWESVQFDVETMFEEAMEMGGVAIFVYALLGYLGDRVGSLQIVLASPRDGQLNDGLLRDALLDQNLTRQDPEDPRKIAA